MNEEPDEVNTYALSIIKAGHDTRELSFIRGNKIINPLTNEPILFQRIIKGLFKDYLGLIHIPLDFGDTPKQKLAQYLEKTIGAKANKPKFKCKAFEIQNGEIQKIHNTWYIYSQRIPRLPDLETGINNCEIEAIQIPEIYQMRCLIHPTHYEIIKKLVLSHRTEPETPTELEIIIESQGKQYKPTSIVWTT